MDRGNCVARCKLIAVSIVWISRPASPSGARIDGYWWKEGMWELIPELVSLARASGPRNRGDFGYARSQLPLGPVGQKNRGRQIGPPPVVSCKKIRLLDLSITGDLRHEDLR